MQLWPPLAYFAAGGGGDRFPFGCEPTSRPQTKTHAVFVDQPDRRRARSGSQLVC